MQGGHVLQIRQSFFPLWSDMMKANKHTTLVLIIRGRCVHHTHEAEKQETRWRDSFLWTHTQISRFRVVLFLSVLKVLGWSSSSWSSVYLQPGWAWLAHHTRVFQCIHYPVCTMMEADQSMKTVGLPLHAAIHFLHPYPLLTRCGGEGGSWKNRVHCVVLQVKVAN